MRVLYLNPFSQQVSGPDESLLTLLARLIPLGVEAHLVLPRAGPQVQRYQELGVKVHFAPLTVLRRRMGALDLALLGPRMTRGVAAVATIARRERIDLIHTNMEVVLDGALASRLLRLPHVLHYRGNTLDRPKMVFDALTRFWVSTAERVFCISNATAAIFRKRGLGAKVQTLYNPVNLAVFRQARRSEEVRQQLGAGPGDFLIGSVGRIHPRKDLATFLRAGALAAQKVPNLRLAVIGSAEAPEELEYRARLDQLASAIGVSQRLCFAGVRSDIPAVLKSLDVLVLSSRNEGFGRVVAEALAAGTSLVVSREGALPELVEVGETGLLATPGDEADFADQIVALLSQGSLQHRWLEAAGKSVQRFDSEAIARLVMTEYTDLLHGRTPSERFET